jgi:hypothetical protein
LEPKLLILGSSDSGKSTLLKQLKIIHGGGFGDLEKKLSQRGIITNIINALSVLMSLSDSSQGYLDILQLEYEWNHLDRIPDKMISRLKSCWSESWIQTMYETAEHNLPDNMS